MLNLIDIRRYFSKFSIKIEDIEKFTENRIVTLGNLGGVKMKMHIEKRDDGKLYLVLIEGVNEYAGVIQKKDTLLSDQTTAEIKRIYKEKYGEELL